MTRTYRKIRNKEEKILAIPESWIKFYGLDAVARRFGVSTIEVKRILTQRPKDTYN